MAAVSHFVSLTPKYISLHHSSSSSAAVSALFAPPSLKSLPKLAFAFSSIKIYAQPTSRFVRKVSISSELEEDETLDLSGSEEPSSEEPSFGEELKVFVGNLPFSVDSHALADLFKQAGVVEVVEVIYDKSTGRSRGFGFVTMSTVEDAEAAAEKLNGYEMEGRAIRVHYGPPPPKGEKPSFRGSRGDERVIYDGNRLYVGNLSWDVDDHALETFFSEHGIVHKARVIYDLESGRSKGFGFVTYSTPEEVDNAIKALDQADFFGRPLRVCRAEARPVRQY